MLPASDSGSREEPVRPVILDRFIPEGVDRSPEAEGPDGGGSNRRRLRG